MRPLDGNGQLHGSIARWFGVSQRSFQATALTGLPILAAFAVAGCRTALWVAGCRTALWVAVGGAASFCMLPAMRARL